MFEILNGVSFSGSDVSMSNRLKFNPRLKNKKRSKEHSKLTCCFHRFVLWRAIGFELKPSNLVTPLLNRKFLIICTNMTVNDIIIALIRRRRWWQMRDGLVTSHWKGWRWVLWSGWRGLGFQLSFRTRRTNFANEQWVTNGHFRLFSFWAEQFVWLVEL